jgi:hypothetical protein
VRPVYGAPHEASELAEPLVIPDEAAKAETAVCRAHKGRIADQLADGDYYGRVYFCPIGRMYWRLTKHLSGLQAPLKFPKGL